MRAVLGLNVILSRHYSYKNRLTQKTARDCRGMVGAIGGEERRDTVDLVA